MKCNLCGEVITDITKGAVILPWGDTCGNCVDDIKEFGTTRILADDAEQVAKEWVNG